jgi:putative membrane protein
MVFWYGPGSGREWLAMAFVSLVVWLALVAGAALLMHGVFRHDLHRDDRTSTTVYPPFSGGRYRRDQLGNEAPAPPEDPGLAAAEKILSERFARGEIDEREFHGRLAALRAAHDRPRATAGRPPQAGGPLDDERLRR